MKRVMSLCAIAVSAAFASTPATSQAAPQAAVSALVKNFIEAEKAYDAPTLGTLISKDYVEVSPAGEIDAHDRFLSFYTLDKKTDWPPMQTADEQVRIFGDTAIDVLTFTYTMPAPGGGVRPLEIRGSFTAQREHGTWKLIGAQYTGIRPMPSPNAAAPAGK